MTAPNLTHRVGPPGKGFPWSGDVTEVEVGELVHNKRRRKKVLRLGKKGRGRKVVRGR